MNDYKILLNYLESLSIDEIVKSISISMELCPNQYNPTFNVKLNIKFNDSTEILITPYLLKNYDNVSSYISIAYYNVYINGINDIFREYANNNTLGKYLMEKHFNLSEEWKLYETIVF